MAIYAYSGLTAKGRTVTGVIDADSPRGALHSLRRGGVFPTAVTQEAAAPRAGSDDAPDSSSWFERISSQDSAMLARQLATLAGAGLPLVDCLGTLIEQAESARLKRVLSHLRQQVREGRALADALADHPRIFGDIYVNMVRAGEKSGTLEAVLARLADYNEGQARFLRIVRSALVYPAVMIGVGTVILLFLLAYVVPQVTRIFTESNQLLPFITRVLLVISSFLAEYWWLVCVATASAVLAMLRFVATARGRAWYDRTLLRVPRLGRLVQRLNVARFARTLSTLLASGVPIVTALGIVVHLVQNSVLRRAVEEARGCVQEGESLAAPLRRSGLFPAFLVQMISVGERTGELEQMLGHAADACDDEVTTALERLTSMIEPLTILVMGGAVLFIVLAILLPIFELNQLVR